MGLAIKKNDKVYILAGRDKGKSGKVVYVYPKKNRALVEGISMAKKHLRKSQQNPQGGIVSRETTVHLSNLSLICPVSGKPSRYTNLAAKDGSKQRLSTKNKAVIG